MCIHIFEKNEEHVKNDIFNEEEDQKMTIANTFGLNKTIFLSFWLENGPFSKQVVLILV
jgi:hypothetical protein